MRKSILYLSGALFALSTISCGGRNDSSNEDSSSEEKGVFDKISDGVGAVKNISKMESVVKDMEKQVNELKTMTPVTSDVLKSVLGESIDGLKRTRLNIGDAAILQFVNATAEYKNEDSSKELRVEIMDGAGEAAASIVSMAVMGLQMTKEEITEQGYEKTTDLDGNRAVIKERTNNDHKSSEIQWLKDNRFLITLKGDGYSFDELNALRKNLDLSGLK